MKNTCDIEGCDEILSPRSKLSTCQKCRASFGYWQKRSAAHIVFRRGRLGVYQSRLDRRFDSFGKLKKEKRS